jgi:hypothetical protein
MKQSSYQRLLEMFNEIDTERGVLLTMLAEERGVDLHSLPELEALLLEIKQRVQAA